MIIDHIGITVKSLVDGIKHWETVFGYKQKTEIITNTRQKVKVVFLSKIDSIDVKLIEPVDSSSAVYAAAQRGGGLHHLCFKCAKLDDEIERLKEIGLRIWAEPQPGEAFENENIVFMYAKQGLNIELIETEKRAGKIDINKKS